MRRGRSQRARALPQSSRSLRQRRRRRSTRAPSTLSSCSRLSRPMLAGCSMRMLSRATLPTTCSDCKEPCHEDSERGCYQSAVAQDGKRRERSCHPVCLWRLRARAQARRRFAHVSRLRKSRYRDSGRPFAQRCRPACLLRIGRSTGLVGNTARIFGYFFNWYICSCILSP